MRRAISPVIATVFLMGIIVATIGAVLTIIYPNLQTIDDQIAINQTSSYLETLDDAVRSLVIQAEGTDKLVNLRSNGGTIMGDKVSTMTIIPFMNGTDMSSFLTTEVYSRLVIQNPLSSNLYSAYEHQYLRGSSDQDFFVLNETTISTSPWTVLNVSRPSEYAILNSSLSYRMQVTNSFTSGNLIETTLSLVQFTFPGELFRSLTSSNVRMKFLGVTEMTIFKNLYNTYAGNIKLSVTTTLTGDSPHLDVPLKFAGSSFFWSLNLKLYTLEVTFE